MHASRQRTARGPALRGSGSLMTAANQPPCPSNQPAKCRSCRTTAGGAEDVQLLAPCACQGFIHRRCLVRTISKNVCSGQANPSYCPHCQTAFTLDAAAFAELMQYWQLDRGRLRQQGLKWQQIASYQVMPHTLSPGSSTSDSGADSDSSGLTSSPGSCSSDSEKEVP